MTDTTENVSSEDTVHDDGGGVGSKELLKRGAVALALALALNWILLYSVVEFDLAPPFEALEYPSVTLFTLLGVAGATVVYGAVTRISMTPDGLFVKIAVGVLLVSFVPDAMLYLYVPEATAGVAVALALMHVTVAAACVFALTEYVEVP